MKKKKRIYLGIGIILLILVIAGVVTSYLDGQNISAKHEPKFCIKIVSEGGNKITYWGLGYKIIRYVGVTPSDPFESSIGIKMGNWFMKYDLPAEPSDKNVTIEYEDQTIKITNRDDIEFLYDIFVDTKYDSELCDGINTHKITIENETYYLKESCREIQKGDKQAKISQEDIDSILRIIDDNR